MTIYRSMHPPGVINNMQYDVWTIYTLEYYLHYVSLQYRHTD